MTEPEDGPLGESRSVRDPVGECRTRRTAGSRSIRVDMATRPEHAATLAIATIVSTMTGLSALSALVGMSGCAGSAIREEGIRTVGVEDLSGGDTPGVQADQVVGPVLVEDETVAAIDDGRRINETVARIESPDGVDETRMFVSESVAIGVAYPVEGLVGQINGRPVYADEFLLPLEDRILRIMAELPLPQAVRELDLLIARRFREYVNSELIIAEAESRLSEEQQQGVLAWLRNAREETITNRGGTRDAATESIEDEFGISIDDFMEQRRSVALGQDLLRKRVQPRAIVSWRDVVQAYRRQFADFNPPAEVRLGRVRLHRERDAAVITDVEAAVADGADFERIVEIAGTTNEGFWIDVKLPEGGLEETSLAGPVKARLDVSTPGVVTDPLDQGPFRSWLTVLSVVRPPGRSLYDPKVQRSLESELSSIRFGQEQQRYIDSLRDRWVSNSIDAMLNRLLMIARQRYLPR